MRGNVIMIISRIQRFDISFTYDVQFGTMLRAHIKTTQLLTWKNVHFLFFSIENYKFVIQMIKYGHSTYQWYPLISTSFSSESAACHVTGVNSEKKTVCLLRGYPKNFPVLCRCFCKLDKFLNQKSDGSTFFLNINL